MITIVAGGISYQLPDTPEEFTWFRCSVSDQELTELVHRIMAHHDGAAAYRMLMWMRTHAELLDFWTGRPL